MYRKPVFHRRSMIRVALLALVPFAFAGSLAAAGEVPILVAAPAGVGIELPVAEPVALPELPASPLESAFPGCASAVDGVGPMEISPAVEPLSPDQRLYLPLPESRDAVLEVRFLVAGESFIIESTRVADADIDASSGKGDIGSGELDSGPSNSSGERARNDALLPPKTIEVLSLRPDLVRKLRDLDASDIPVDVEIVHDGALVERIEFAELVGRSVDLSARFEYPTYVATLVEGPGSDWPIVPRPKSAGGCGYCDSSVPCDAIGPYDPGKGECVLCWEIGDCDPGPCACESVQHQYWSNWYGVSVQPLGGYGCIQGQGSSPSQRGGRVAATYRRDLIQLVQICPECPGCAGCYLQSRIVNQQTNVLNCYLRLPNQACTSWDPVVPSSAACP